MITRYLYAIAASISVSKITTMLEVDQTFGPMTKIIKEMTKVNDQGDNTQHYMVMGEKICQSMLYYRSLTLGHGYA